MIYSQLVIGRARTVLALVQKAYVGLKQALDNKAGLQQPHVDDFVVIDSDEEKNPETAIVIAKE